MVEETFAMELIDKLKAEIATGWLNPVPLVPPHDKAIDREIEAAARRLEDFAPLIRVLFPETAPRNGIIESPLTPIPRMREHFNETLPRPIAGDLLLKRDSDLPIAGSVKARGGIHEVLVYTEKIMRDNGLIRDRVAEIDLTETDAAGKPRLRDDIRQLLARYTIQVGSTGNLGLSIGMMSAALGFRVIVHMSADAKAWKKEKLREHGVTVKEYADDYSVAVAAGRAESDRDPNSFFVDDERSVALFSGYAVAGRRFAAQWRELGQAAPSAESPLFVYIPCGVGGAPGGIAYGLRQALGNDVRVFFAEPTAACCMLLALMTGKGENIAVADIGLSGRTEADGLAVGRASGLVSRLMRDQLAGIVTVRDEVLPGLTRALFEREGLFIEPSAAAGFGAFVESETLATYVAEAFPEVDPKKIRHVVWATGGSLVPEAERARLMT